MNEIQRYLERAEVKVYKDLKTGELIFESRNSESPLTIDEKREISLFYAIQNLQPVKFKNNFKGDK